MKFIKFPQAQRFLPLPTGPVPFYQEANLAVIKIQLSTDEIKKIKQSNGELYVSVPVTPGYPPPVPVFIIGINPFPPPIMQVNGKEEN